MKAEATSKPVAKVHSDPGGLQLHLCGDWHFEAVRPPLLPLVKALKAFEASQEQDPAEAPGQGPAEASVVGAEPRVLGVVDVGIGRWDSSLLLYLQSVEHKCEQQGWRMDRAGLPAGAQSLMAMAEAVPEKADASQQTESQGFLAAVGQHAMAFFRSIYDLLDFGGQCAIAFLKALFGQAQYRGSDFWLVVQESGPGALPIIVLLSFLVGLIFAFVGAIQLSQFGATIYIANLVGISMTREMGAIITGVIMSGRTGASFAAAIGSMKVNEEIDALNTLGVAPVEFLALPRLMALLLMMPLLVIVSNIVGILGGMFVANVMFDISVQQYLNQTIEAVTLTQFFAGISKSIVFAVLVAGAGCLRGLQCGSGASAVGQATTSAVVTGITAIIIADALFAFLFEALGI
jgi:phospholipid/cholesterol/gamma-HCH transport system permease protein